MINLAPLSCKKAPKLLRLSAKKLQRLEGKDALGKLKIFKFYEFLFYPEMGIFLLVTSDFSWYYKTKLGDLEGGHRDE